MKRQTASGGFTLVELTVTLAVVGIFAAIAIPSIIGVMPRVRLSDATRTLANDIAMLRMTAIAKGAGAQVVFNPGADTYRLFRRTQVGQPLARVSAATLAPAADLQNLAYLDGTAAPNTLVLDSNGTTSVPLEQQALLVTLQTPDGTYKRRVLVWTTGRIHTQKWAGGTSWVED